MKIEFNNQTGDGTVFHMNEELTVELQGQYSLLSKEEAVELAKAILSYYGVNHDS